MMINTNALVAMNDANKNFSKVARLVDEQGSVCILKNNKPCYVLLPFQEYETIEAARESAKRLAVLNTFFSEIEASDEEVPEFERLNFQEREV
ncbi:MAG: type II toxin-antitoxin system Phd/YefM family antitoxin [Oscillospiraceae bacterium]|nr:type II toxin-antitoxin system Phd/YefM family antitoxin [Oscillospiraceae bacterium]